MLKRHAGLALCLLLAAPSGPVLAEEFDAIVSEQPKPDLPFFGSPPAVKGEQAEPDLPFFGSPVLVDEQKERRQAEGITFRKNGSVDMKKHQWDC